MKLWIYKLLKYIQKCWQATVYTKNCYSSTISNTYPSFMHHGTTLENNFH